MTDRYRDVVRVLWQVLGANLLVAVAKIGLGYATGTVSILSDGFHSLTDSASNVVALVGVFYFLVPQLADLPRSLDEVRDAQWTWALAALVLSGCSYVGATLSMMGSVPQRLPLGTTFLAQLASTFTNRITPVVPTATAVFFGASYHADYATILADPATKMIHFIGKDIIYFHKIGRAHV